MDCEYYSSCLNSEKCYRCFDNSLLKLPIDKKLKSMKKRNLNSYKDNNDEKSWRKLEQDVADKLNYIPTINEARRTKRSGALWFEQGDIKDTVLHPECKERIGTLLKSGEKSLTIHKSWIEKAKSECINTSKFMCLPFRFKGDSNIYTVIDFDDLSSLVTLYKSYVLDNELKDKEIERLNKQLKKLQK